MSLKLNKKSDSQLSGRTQCKPTTRNAKPLAKDVSKGTKTQGFSSATVFVPGHTKGASQGCFIKEQCRGSLGQLK